MKKKLTVTIDAKLLPQAKAYARKRGVSLSELIERALAEMSQGETSAHSFSSRWRGKFKTAKTKLIREDERYKALAKKYL